MPSHDASVTELNLSHLLTKLPKLSHNASKFTQGHVLVIGGDTGMSGAAKLAALGALRVGAGLVTVLTHPDHADYINISQPELMCRHVKQPQDILSLAEKATAVALGPGTGSNAWSENVIEAALTLDKPMVVDAGALRYLAKHPLQKSNWVLTPHVGEAAALLGQGAQQRIADDDRLTACQKLQAQYHGVVICKGANTVIQTDDAAYFCPDGNPGMASGGMGDLLTGVIAGLIAQGHALSFATQLGVCLHAKAADLTAAALGMRGLIATDILPQIQKLLD